MKTQNDSRKKTYHNFGCFGFTNLGGVGRGSPCNNSVSSGFFCRHHEFQAPADGIEAWVGVDGDETTRGYKVVVDEASESEDRISRPKTKVSDSVSVLFSPRITRSRSREQARLKAEALSRVTPSKSPEKSAYLNVPEAYSRGEKSSKKAKQKHAGHNLTKSRVDPVQSTVEELSSPDAEGEEYEDGDPSVVDDIATAEAIGDVDEDEDNERLYPPAPTGDTRHCEMPHCTTEPPNVAPYLTKEGNFLCQEHLYDHGHRCQRASRGQLHGRRCPRYVPFDDQAYAITAEVYGHIDFIPEVLAVDSDVVPKAWLCGRCAYDARLTDGEDYEIDDFHDNHAEALKFVGRDVRCLGQYFTDYEEAAKVKEESLKRQRSSESGSEPAAKRTKTDSKVKFRSPLTSPNVTRPKDKGTTKKREYRNLKADSGQCS